MFKWLKTLGEMWSPTKDNTVVIRGSVAAPAPAPVAAEPAATTPTPTASTGPVSSTPIVTGIEQPEDPHIPPEVILEKPLVEHPRIVSDGDSEHFEPASKARMMFRHPDGNRMEIDGDGDVVVHGNIKVTGDVIVGADVPPAPKKAKKK